MTTLSEREHARHAKALIKACGGPEEVERLTGLSGGMLSKYQHAHYDVTMPARLINTLEDYCERRIYSSALFGAIAAPAAEASIADLACDLTEAVARVQSRARDAMRDGRLSQRETDELAALQAEVRQLVDRMESGLRASDIAPALKAV
jgi:hypothetical protein